MLGEEWDYVEENSEKLTTFDKDVKKCIICKRLRKHLKLNRISSSEKAQHFVHVSTTVLSGESLIQVPNLKRVDDVLKNKMFYRIKCLRSTEHTLSNESVQLTDSLDINERVNYAFAMLKEYNERMCEHSS